MTDFKSNIKNKYNQEVQPTFSEENWESFLAFRDEQKEDKRRFFIWFYFGFGMLAMSFICLSLVWPPKLKSYTVLEHNTQSPNKFIEKRLDESTEISNTEIKLGENINQELLKEGGKKELDPHSNTKSRHQVNINLSNIPNASLEQNQNSSIVDDPSEFMDEIVKKVKRQSITIQELPYRAIDWLHFKGDKIEFQDFTRLNLVASRRPSGIQAKMYSGISIPFHVKTVEEQAYQFGGNIYKPITGAIKAKIGVELETVNFSTKIIDQSLGIRSVQAPSMEVELANIIVESVQFNTFAGLDFGFNRANKFNPYLGVGYGLAVELVKDIDYEFEGPDSDQSYDDVIISEKNTERFFVPHMLKFDAGFLYRTSNLGLDISIGYPIQLNKDKIKLLNQIQVNFGINLKL